MSHSAMNQRVKNNNSTIRMATDPLLYDFFPKFRNFGVSWKAALRKRYSQRAKQDCSLWDSKINFHKI